MAECRQRQVVCFAVEDRTFAVGLEDVEHVLPAVAPEADGGGEALRVGTVNVHGDRVPLYHLWTHVGAPPRAVSMRDHMLLLRTRARRLALLVDRVTGVEQVDAGVDGGETGCQGVRRVEPSAAPGAALLLVEDVCAMLTEPAAAACREALKGTGEAGA
jgi:hypothetical protein